MTVIYKIVNKIKGASYDAALILFKEEVSYLLVNLK
jgi:hypothetical protein